jgi:hypothetical protein
VHRGQADMYAVRVDGLPERCGRRRFEPGVGCAHKPEGVKVLESWLVKASKCCRGDELAWELVLKERTRSCC